jgi:hypothetical protein
MRALSYVLMLVGAMAIGVLWVFLSKELTRAALAEGIINAGAAALVLGPMALLGFIFKKIKNRLRRSPNVQSKSADLAPSSQALQKGDANSRQSSATSKTDDAKRPSPLDRARQEGVPLSILGSSISAEHEFLKQQPKAETIKTENIDDNQFALKSNYKILRSGSPDGLELAVQNYLALGYRPVGGPFSATYDLQQCFYQAVIHKGLL